VRDTATEHSEQRRENCAFQSASSAAATDMVCTYMVPAVYRVLNAPERAVAIPGFQFAILRSVTRQNSEITLDCWLAEGPCVQVQAIAAKPHDSSWAADQRNPRQRSRSRQGETWSQAAASAHRHREPPPHGFRVFTKRPTFLVPQVLLANETLRAVCLWHIGH
jgi:hypothetical protein